MAKHDSSSIIEMLGQTLEDVTCQGVLKGSSELSMAGPRNREDCFSREILGLSIYMGLLIQHDKWLC